MSRRAVRERCAAIARTVPVPDPFDLRALLDQLGRDRGRAIHLLPFPMPAGSACGICVATDTADYIFVTDAVTGTQRDHIALHELAHLLLRHGLQMLTDEDATRWLFPYLDPALVRNLFRRTNYTAPQEREAEILGTLIRQRAGLWQPHRSRASRGGPVDATVEQLSRSLEHGSDHG